MMTRFTVAALAVLLGTGAALADGPAGAASCSGCHAASARVETPVPPIKGRSQADIADAMIEYKSAKRPGTIMDRTAKGCADEEMRVAHVAYAGQK